jgi:hypothetical protein
MIPAKNQEAARLRTPPINEDRDGKTRGFFFGAPPDESDSGDSLLGSSQHPKLPSCAMRKSLSSTPKEWWELLPKKPVRRSPGPSCTRDYGEAPRDFEFDVPEHLPSSPLCPANVKHHKSRSFGLCVYHGRRRGASKLMESLSQSSEYSAASPPQKMESLAGYPF